MKTDTVLDLQSWANANEPGKEMFYAQGFWNQVMFLRDDVAGVLSSGLGAYSKIEGRVISQHRSKSVNLPVVAFVRPDLELRIVLRNNFYNWKMSVSSKAPIEADFTGLFIESPPLEPDYTGDNLSHVYFEGFPREEIFGYRKSDSLKWSAEIHSNFDLMTTLFLIMRGLKQVKPLVYTTRATHKIQLDEESKRLDKYLAEARAKREAQP